MKKVILLLAMLLVGAANASTFTETLRVNGTWQFMGDVSHFPPLPSGPQNWTGQVTVVTSSSLDGIYTGASLLGVDYSGSAFNASSFNLRQSYVFPPFSVAIHGGQVTSILGNFIIPACDSTNCGFLSFNGMNMNLYNPYGVPVGDYGSAVLSAELSAVPLPGALSLMLSGLGLMGGIARRRKVKQA